MGESLHDGWHGLFDVTVAAAVWPLWLSLPAIVGLVRVLRRKKASS